MCKSCKNLKRLKDLDEKEYKKIIENWKRRDCEARTLLKVCVDLFHAFPVPFCAYEVHENRIKDFLGKSYIGK